MPKYREYKTCCSLIEWWDYAYRSYGVSKKEALFHIPNQGAHGSAATGMHLKRMGVRKGSPDYMLAVPRSGFSGLFLEIKTKTGRASPEQIGIHAMHKENGYAVEVAHSLDEARKVIHEYLKK